MPGRRITVACGHRAAAVATTRGRELQTQAARGRPVPRQGHAAGRAFKKCFQANAAQTSRWPFDEFYDMIISRVYALFHQVP
jgi:hypothetical protein